MAELHVERRERSMWPWLAVVLATLVLIWLVLSPANVHRTADGGEVAASGAPGRTASDRPPAGLAPDAPGEVATFLAFVAENRARSMMDSTHFYTATGIRLLAAALGSLAPRDSSGHRVMQPQLDSMRVLASAMQQDPRSTAHARQARLAFDIAGTVMQHLQLRGVTAAAVAAAQVQDARIAAWGVSESRRLLAQRDAVEKFFDRAAAAVDAMARRTA